MQLVEKHMIDRYDPRFKAIDEACWLSKNLYNRANYILRQNFINSEGYFPYTKMAKLMQGEPDYQALPRKVSQQVLMQLDRNWRAFFAALREWQAHPDKFLGRPRLPKYKPTQKGRNMLIYTEQAISKPALEKGKIAPSQLGVEIKTQQNPESIHQVRIVPRSNHYVVEVIYTVESQFADVNPDWIAGLDIGLDNLAAIASNKPGFTPILVNGRPLKAINQLYNKLKASLQSQLPHGQYTSQKVQALTEKRNRRVDHQLHAASRAIIDYLVQEQIGTFVIGKNKHWKQGINIGMRNNQNFTHLPHARFIDMLTYKAQLLGIKVIITEESYTSKCSFLDREAIGKQARYAGRRVKRGLFRAGNGQVINADINAAFNIIRKVIPNAFADGIAAVVVQPVRVMPTN